MESATDSKRYKIPQDVLMDILRVLFRAGIKHKITGIREKENIILLQANYINSKVHRQAQQNLESILQEYMEYMEGMMNDKTLFMDEEDFE